MVFGFFKKKPVAAPVTAAAQPAVGRWVENMEPFKTAYGYEILLRTGTYKWEGPEPPGGRPQNPAETPFGIAMLARIAHNKAMMVENKKKDEALLKFKQKYPPSKDEEENKAVIAELDAKRKVERDAYWASLYTPDTKLLEAEAVIQEKTRQQYASQPYGGRSKKRTKKAGRRHKRSTKRRHSS
jgi:hypothetical protein